MQTPQSKAVHAAVEGKEKLQLQKGTHEKIFGTMYKKGTKGHSIAVQRSRIYKDINDHER